MQENHVAARFTVYFDEPFWVGVYERLQDGKTEACRIVFGAEPKDYEVYDFLLLNWARLRFSPPLASEERVGSRPNPKRLQRLVKRSLAGSGVGTKAQLALKLQQEERAGIRKARCKERKEEAKERQFHLRQQKKKEKHRGR